MKCLLWAACFPWAGTLKVQLQVLGSRHFTAADNFAGWGRVSLAFPLGSGTRPSSPALLLHRSPSPHAPDPISSKTEPQWAPGVGRELVRELVLANP